MSLVGTGGLQCRLPMTDEKVSSSDFSKMFMATPGSEVCGGLTIMSDLQNFPCRCSVCKKPPKETR